MDGHRDDLLAVAQGDAAHAGRIAALEDADIVDREADGAAPDDVSSTSSVAEQVATSTMLSPSSSFIAILPFG
jgi:hypothetical protein